VDLLPDGALQLGTEATGIEPGDEQHPARLLTNDGPIEADLVIAADGVN
jgi:2-polyprenyl-6-methoxyphenol hydroxylase-like FAD-dependent oxidoreductase